MQRSRFFILCLLMAAAAFSAPVFHDALPFLEGYAFEGRPAFGRLPRDMEETVRPPVWRLGMNSAGLAAHFRTNTKEIRVRWEVLNDFHMVHMAGTGIRGVDLYVRERNKWHHLAAGKPYEKHNTALLARNSAGDMREYMLYCPLYDGLSELALGLDPDARIHAVENEKKPIVFYGTSITQGGCASRPGMAYPAIIGRMLDRETVNLGFSGNGRMDPEIIDVIATADAACYVIDCLPNMDLDGIRERAEREIRRLLEARPGTPVLLIPGFMPENIRYDPEKRREILAENAELEAIYRRLKKAYPDLHYLPFRKLREVPAEGTVDGIHLTDPGQLRMAEVLSKKIRRLVK